MKEGWQYKKLGEIASFVGDGDWIETLQNEITSAIAEFKSKFLQA